MKKRFSNHPIGAKVLTPPMMECVFNHTEEVLQAIATLRRSAETDHENFCDVLRKNPEDALSVVKRYNNAISIIGSRGTGKTSIIMTLQYIIRYGEDCWKNDAAENESFCNIMMPILVPQDFASGQTLLSWIIVQLLEKAKTIQKEINNHGSIYGGTSGPFQAWVTDVTDRFCDPLKECMDSLKKAFELRYKNEIRNINSESEHIYQYMEEVRRDTTLVHELHKLISMITDYYRYYRPNSEKKLEPMIFFVIDDLDLAPERSQETLMLVLRYLQHPNIVILTGWNQEVYQSHLTMDILRKHGGVSSGLIEINGDYTDVFMSRQRKRINLLDSARRLAVDNLKKAFPPVLRYEIRSLSTAQRARFPFREYEGIKEDDETQGSFLLLIEAALLASHREEKGIVPFLHNEQGELIESYMRIFDNKGRGLINVYNGFASLKETFEQWKEGQPLDITTELRTLFDMILFSNTHFVPYRRGIRDLVRIDRIEIAPDGGEDKSICEFYCNYQQVAPVLDEYKGREGQARSNYITERYRLESEYNYFPSVVIDVFILLNFMENLFRYICKMPIYEHGGFAFSEILNEVNKPVILSDGKGDILSYALLCAGINEVRLFPTTDNFRVNLFLLDAYEKNGFSDRQYDFTGAYSYCRLSAAISKLMSNGNRSVFTTDEKESVETGGIISYKIDRNLFMRMRENCPEWMMSIERLFGALIFSKENVRRLSLFRCYMLQGREDDAYSKANMKTITMRKVSSCTRLYEMNIEKIVENINDLKMDILVDCLYELELLRTKKVNEIRSNKYASDIMDLDLLMKLLEKENQKELGNWRKVEDCQTVVGDIEVALLLIEECSEEEKKKYEVIFRKAIAEEHDIILWNLKIRLIIAFFEGFKAMEADNLIYEYLLKASKAILGYREKWVLNHIYETDEIAQAVGDIRSILQNSGAQDAHTIEQKLIRFFISGQNGRYGICSALEKWINQNGRDISYRNRESFDRSLAILRNASSKKLMRMTVTSEIESVIDDLGDAISEMSAKYAIAEDATRDKSSSERARTSWPIIEKNRKAFDNWKKLFMSLKEERTLNDNRTLFNQ